MKDRLLDSTINGISDGLNNVNLGGITDFASPDGSKDRLLHGTIDGI